ncbi:MAG: hypothetical protein KatS3mg050_4883 [Litorilinea sp.]|uniref:Transglycosylase SLT domain-containing protein n=1 Tax=Litorilinea aerophila TaxID=1204385 RepID=A0A540VJN2_9CHLR|nr:MAG: hypothetical protein KatS3mg050_0716 [Litorilinea sp.]GIV77350.1 MAG: hypothetical protein KatS3mg050_1744 [Litorilinea sp.]GIV80489.1 MAG: hypothetical protein KatS3mg050_4883 [Litorilinea sp.]
MLDEQRHPSTASRQPDSTRARPSPQVEATRFEALDDAEAPQVPPSWTALPVLEIDGEATPVAPPPQSAGRQPAPERRGALPEQQDEILVVSLGDRTPTVAAGEHVELAVGLLNNGPRPATFIVTVEGWLDPAWLPSLPVYRTLQPGERAQLTLTLAPPRHPASRAGEHPFAVVVRAPDAYPGRQSRVAARLVIEPFYDLRLGRPTPGRVSLAWFRREAWVRLPVANGGNAPLRCELQGRDRHGRCQLSYRVSYDSGLQPNPARFLLQPGERLWVAVRVTPRQRPVLGIRAEVAPLYFRLWGRGANGEVERHGGGCAVALAPWIGLGQMFAAAGVLLLAVIGMAMLALGALLALPGPAAGEPGVDPGATPVAVPIAILVRVADPVPTRPAVASMPGPVPDGMAAPPAPAASTGGVSALGPVVLPEQVTAPGEVLPSPPPTATPVPRQTMTYQQMFQEIGARYDLNWRLLAAQAYVESGFDSLAMGSHGDLGLMQILPTTWQEWAPALQVNDPFDSYSNVLVAAAYLDYLRTLLGSRGYPQEEWMLVAYNWGPDQLLDFLAAGGTWETLAPELQDYATQIRRLAATIPAE